MMKRKSVLPIVTLFLMMLAHGWYANLHETDVYSSSDEASALLSVTVDRVVDGDTIVVTREDQKFKVRLIGVNTPESVSPDAAKNTLEGKKASDFTKERLPKGTKVYLEFDQERTDKYGRTLAYVWLSDDYNPGDYSDFCAYNFGAVLLQNTDCQAVYYAPNGKYRTWYEQLEGLYQK